MQEDSVFQKSRQPPGQPPNTTIRVFVWGLNDKEQLGGPKGSKIKVPVPVESMAALQPVFVAGGSKSLFFVTASGKVN